MEIHDDTINVSLRADELLAQLYSINSFNWHQEYAKYMLESIPKMPFKFTSTDFNNLHLEMKNRSLPLEALLNPNEKLVKMSNFWRMGLVDSFPSNTTYHNDVTKSIYFPDEAISSHVRFP